MKKLIIYVLALGLFICGCKNKQEDTVLTKEVTFRKEGTATLLSAATDSIIVKLDIEIAESEYETQTGLMYRKGMEDHQGMLFVFEDIRMRSFYMKNTQFPLDIIFLDESYRIINVQKNAQPYNKTSLPSEAPSKYVLEVNGGLTDKWGLLAGDTMEFSRITN